MNAPPPPPPPPPHGSNNTTGRKDGLPDGSYDIFIVPPHSSGGGFVYFPSLQTHRNSFIAGSASTLLVVLIWSVILPALKSWISSLAAGGGASVIALLLIAGIGGWTWGKTQLEGQGFGSAEGGTKSHTAGAGASHSSQSEPRPPPSWQRGSAGAAGGASGSAKGVWEKAREETRKKEEERKRTEDLKKKRETDERERVRQREKDAREREARERRDREGGGRPSSPNKNHRHPTAKTATDDASSYSFRPYDSPNPSGYKPASASSIYSESSYAPSHSTSGTTPPPSQRGPYRNKDPDKIIIKAVYSFNNISTKTPLAKLISGVGSVTDGLILRITTEGLFIDDDVRGVPQREWDVKAWTLKLVEVWCPHLHALGACSGSSPAATAAAAASVPRHSAVAGIFGKKWASKTPTAPESDSFVAALTHTCRGPSSASSSSSRSNAGISLQSGEFHGLHVLRASIRDADGKRYVVVLQEEEGWKVAVGLQRLRRGSQVRALGVSGIPLNETKAILENMGWL